MNPVIIIPTLTDNFSYLYPYTSENALVIDPSDPQVIIDQIKSLNLHLTAILATHHHYDHTAAIPYLIKLFNCPVFSAKNPNIIIPSAKINTIPTPGHTTDSVCFFVPPEIQNPPILFTGDTLFIAGCGRPFECSPQTMHNSLQAIAALPEDTLIYPGHNYTEENCLFALTLEPENEITKNLLTQTQQKPPQQTVPSTLAQEKQTNPFLRTNSPQIRSALNMQTAPAHEVFAELRKRKTLFG